MYELLKSIILPPASLLIAALFGQFVWGRTKPGRRAVTASLLLLYLLATPMISDAMLSSLEIFPPLPADGPIPQEAQAIVILSAESLATPEYPTLSPGALTLERLRYGAQLHRRTGLPILVTGGTPTGRPVSLALLMRHSLIDDFQVPVRWIEPLSEDTRQNAARSATILKAEGIIRIFLVTHAWHMPRAKLAFERAGMTVIAAPTVFTNAEPSLRPGILERIREMVPTATALQNSFYAVHEMVGLAYYWLVLPR